MEIDPGKLDITINENDQRFEAYIGEEYVYLSFRRHSDRITLIHTDVPPEIEGHGIGSALIKFALDYARAENLEVLPLCPFAKGYLRKHQEYLSLVPEKFRTGL